MVSMAAMAAKAVNGENVNNVWRNHNVSAWPANLMYQINDGGIEAAAAGGNIVWRK